MSEKRSYKRRITPAGARKKGHAFENHVASLFRQIGFLKTGRQLEFQKHHANGVDLESTGPFRVQCKKFKKYPNISVIEEIQDKTGIPVLIAAGDFKPAMVALPLEDFLRMAEEFMRSRPNEVKEAHRWTDPRDIDLGF